MEPDPTFVDWIARLTAARAADDPEEYYRTLAERDNYGALALGVVLDNTLVGVVANNYARNKLENDLGYSYGGSAHEQLRVALMQADHSQRVLTGFTILSGESISNYHDTVFTDVFGADASPAWAPYYVVRVLDDYEIWKDAAWLQQGFVVSAMVDALLFGSDEEKRQQAFEWLQDMYSGPIFDPADELVWGDGVLLESVLEFGLEAADDYEADLDHASLGVGAENPIVAVALETAATFHVFEAGEQLFDTTSSSLSFALADVSVEADYRQQTLDLLRLGLKFDLADGDLDLARGDGGAELGESFALIDAFVPVSVSAQTGGSSVEGSEEADLLIGSNAEATLAAAGGSDLIYAAGGDDTLLGGDGCDTLMGGAGSDYLLGGVLGETEQDDFLFDGEGADVLEGGEGIDRIVPTRKRHNCNPAWRQARGGPILCQIDIS